jgi:hypothetical protein
MSPEQRAEVYCEYRGFAAELKRRNSPTGRAPARLDIDAPVRVPVEEIDVFRAENRLVCTQIRTRKRLTLRGETARMLAPHLTGHPFTMADLNGSQRDRRVLTLDLGQAGMLVPSGDDG